MNNRIARREVAKQFIIAFELLLEWKEQKENSNGETTGKDVGKESIETRLLTAPDAVRILNISKDAANRLIQVNEIPSLQNNQNVMARKEDLDEFIFRNFVSDFLSYRQQQRGYEQTSDRMS